MWTGNSRFGSSVVFLLESQHIHQLVLLVKLVCQIIVLLFPDLLVNMLAKSLVNMLVKSLVEMLAASLVN